MEGDNLMATVAVDLGPGHAAKEIPRVTNWVLQVSTTYPYGRLRFYPAVEGGITKTYAHQLRNDVDKGKSYRNGYPCLSAWGRVLRHDREEVFDEHRLEQRGLRLIQWLQAAEAGTLIQPGNPIEFPQMPMAAGPRLAYHSTCLPSSAAWTKPGQCGSAVLLDLPGRQATWFLNEVRHAQQAETTRWGDLVPNRKRAAAWVVTSGLPVRPPWEPIATATELDELLRKDGVSLAKALAALPPSGRTSTTVLLIGAHTPRLHGEPPSRLTWHGVKLEIPAALLGVFKRRPNLAAARLVASKAPVKWLPNRDYRPSQHLMRGSLDDNLIDATVCIIGCGALGSQVAEHLARGGVSSFVLVDGENLEPGNLVRHTLTYRDLDAPKVHGLTERLRAVHPGIRVVEIARKLPLGDADMGRLAACSHVLNLTADTHVRGFLGAVTWQRDALLVTAAISAHATHAVIDVQRGATWAVNKANGLFHHFEALLESGIDDAIREHGEYGCWNPLFPAKHYDVAARAADIVRHLDQADPPQGFACYPTP